MRKTLLLALGLLLFSFVWAQSNSGVVEPDAKLKKYHSILLKRPESANLFQRFQSSWLSKHDEESLAKFLKKKADEGKAADMQIYAYFLMQRGMQDQAIIVLTSAIKLDSKNKQAYLDRAKALSKRLDFEKAVVDLDKAISLGGDSDSFLLTANKLKGRYLTRQGLADEAVAHWSKLAEQNGNDQELIEDVIDILMGDGLFEPALQHATKLRDMTRDPYKKALRTLRVGDILQKRGDRDRAINVYVETLNLSGGGSWLEREVIAQIEAIYRKEDNLVGLRDQLKALSEKFAQRLQIIQKYANVLSESGEHKKARDLYFEIIKRSPDDDNLKKSLLLILERAKDYAAARQLLKNLVEVSPKDSELHVDLAEICFHLKDKKGIKENLDLYHKKVSKGSATVLRYASLLDKYNFKGDALQVYKNIEKDYKKSEDALFRVANYYYLVDQKDSAQKIWTELSKHKDEAVITRLLDVLLLNGQIEKAHQVLKEQKEQRKFQARFVKLAVRVAEVAKDADLAIEMARVSLKLAEKPFEIDASILQLTRVIKKFDEVATSLESLQSKSKLTSREKFLYASLLEEAGENQKSDKIVAELAASNSIPALQQVVRVYSRRYELTKAAAILEKILKLPGGLKSSYLKKLYEVYSLAGDSNKALATVKRWKTLAPNDKQAWLMEVELLEVVKGSAEALKQLRKGMDRFEDNVEINSKLASLFLVESKYSQAKQVFWRLYDESKDITERMQWAQQLAKTCAMEGTTNELIDTLNQRRRSSPRSIAPIMALAEVYRSQDQNEERRNLLLEAARLRPEDADLFIEIAKSDMRNGDLERAKEALFAAQKVDKTNKASSMLARIFMDEGEFEKGVAQLEKMMLGKRNARSVESVCLSLLNQHGFDEVDALLKENIAHFPEDWRLRIIAAVNDYELGYLERSLATWFDLLAVQNEIKGLSTGWKVDDYIAGGYSRGALDMSKLPPIHKDLYVAKYLHNFGESLVGNQRQNYRWSSRSVSANSAAASSKLPRELKGLRVLARGQIVKLLNELQKTDRKDWEAKAKQAGFIHFDIWQDIIVSPDSLRRVSGAGTEEKSLRLDKPFFLERFLIDSINDLNFSVDAKALGSIKKYEKNASEFLKQYLPYFYDNKQDQKKIEERYISLMPAEGEVPEITVLALFSLHKNVFSNNEKVKELSPKVKAVFKRYLKETKAKGKVAAPNFRSGSMSMRGVLVYISEMLLMADTFSGDDYAEIVKLIENDSFDKLANNFASHSAYGNQQKISLTFPPKDLVSVSRAQLSLLSHQGLSGPKQIAINAEGLSKHLAKFTNPILRILATHFCKPSKDLSELINEAKKIAKYRSDAELLEAAYLHQSATFKDLAKLLKVLDSARSHSVNRAQKVKIDSYLAYLPLDAKYRNLFKKLSDEQKLASKTAARRLMIGRSVTSVEEIQSLIVGLDMQKEKARFLTKGNQSIRQSKKKAGGLVGSVYRTQPNNSGNSSSRPSEPHEKVEAYFKGKKNEAALRLASKELRMNLRQELYNNYNVNELVKVVTNHKAQKNLLALFHPKQSISPRRWMDYYKIAEILKDKKAQEEAVAFLSKLSSVPQTVKIPLAIALYDKDKLKAMNLLTKGGNSHKIINGFQSQLQGNREKPERYLKIVRFLADFMDTLDKDTIPQVSMSYLVELVGAATRMTGNSYGFEDVPDDKKKLAEEARKAGIRIFKHCLTNPGAAESAFSYYYEKHEKAKTLPKLVDLAVQSLLKTGFSSGDSQSAQYVFGRGEEDSLRPRREYFILSEMYRQKKNDLITDKQMEKLLEGHEDDEPFFAFARKLVNLTDKEFLEKIQELKKEQDFFDVLNFGHLVSIRKNLNHQLLYTDKLFDCIIERLAKEDVEQKYQQLLAHIGPDSNLFQNAIYTLVDGGDNKKLVQYLDRLGQIQNKGKDSEQEKIVGWVGNNARWSRNSRFSAACLFASIHNVAVRNPKMVSDAVKVGEKHHYWKGDSHNRFPLNADKWFAQFKQSAFFVPLAQFKPTMLSKDKFREAFAKANIGASFDDDSTKAILSDFDLLISVTKENRYGDEKSQNQLNKLIKKLNAVTVKEAYMAQLASLLLSRNSHEDVVKFVKKYKNDISGASKEHKEFLRELLNVTEDIGLQQLLKRNRLLSILPPDKKKLQNQMDIEVKAFLAMPTPLPQTKHYSFNQLAVKLLKQTIPSDIDLSKKILDKFIDIVEGTPQLSQRFSTDNKAVTTLQAALSDDLFDSLRRAKIYPKDLLKLVYHLAQREDHYKFNLTLILQNTIPINWTSEHGLPRNRHAAVKIIMKEYADIYSKLEDEDMKKFYRAAWFVYAVSFEHFKKLHFYMWGSHDKFKRMKRGKGHEAHDEFIEWVATASYFDSPGLSNDVLFINRNKYDSSVKVWNQAAMKWACGMLLKELDQQPLYNRMLMCQALMQYDITKATLRFSNALNEKVIETFVASVAAKSEYRYCADNRFILGIYERIGEVKPELQEKTADAAYKALVSAIDYMSNGGSMHRNQFLNLFMLSIVHPKGEERVVELAKKHPQEFKGHLAVVRYLVGKGRIDEAYKLLPPTIVLNIVKVYSRNFWTASHEKNLPMLLKRYPDKVHKATIYAHFLMDPDFKVYGVKEKSFNERVVELAKLIVDADPEFKKQKEMKIAYDILYSYMNAGSTQLFAKYFDKHLAEVTAEAYNKNLLLDDGRHNSDAYRYLHINMMNYAVVSGNEDFIADHVKNALSMVRKHRKSIPWDKLKYVSNVIRPFLTTYYELYGRRDSDEKLKKLAPLYRMVCRLVMEADRSGRKVNGVGYMRKWQPAPHSQHLNHYIHLDLELVDDYKAWKGKLPGNIKNSYYQVEKFHPMAFPRLLQFIGRDRFGSVKRGFRDCKDMFVRVLNNKQFQKDVVTLQQSGGAVDYVMDAEDCTHSGMLEILNGDEIKVSVPAFAVALERDRAKAYALLGNFDEMEKRYKSMKALLQKHPIPNKVSHTRYYTRSAKILHFAGRKDLASKFIPEEIIQQAPNKIKKETLGIQRLVTGK